MGSPAKLASGIKRAHWYAAMTTGCRVALAGTALLLIIVAYFPFAWSPPRTVRNQISRNADGSLRFGEMNYARTPGTPDWLQDSRTSGTIQIELEADPASVQEKAASIIMLASDYWHTDFAVEQDHSGLLVWLRRPGSDANGDPPFVIDGALQPHRWTSVRVMLRQHDFRIDVNGATRLIKRFPADPSSVWTQGEIALGDEVHGGAPWQGTIRIAKVHTPAYTVNYVRQGALSIPVSYLYFPDRIEPFPPTDLESWLSLFLGMALFALVGFLVVWARKPPMRSFSATLLVAAFAVALAAGKFLFNARHTSVADIVTEAVGGLLGAVLASRLARAKSMAWPSAVDVSTPGGA